MYLISETENLCLWFCDFENEIEDYSFCLLKFQHKNKSFMKIHSYDILILVKLTLLFTFIDSKLNEHRRKERKRGTEKIYGINILQSQKVSADFLRF